MKNVEKYIEEYLRHITEIRFSGAAVAETSFYPPLQKLLSDLGGTLKPKVRCIIHPKNQGAGIPDGGFFTLDQFPKQKAEIDFAATIPTRGVLEVKSPGDDTLKVAQSDQVDKYFRRYRQVLVTNCWDFVLVGQNAAGDKAILERFRLADSEPDFWRKASKAHALAADIGQPFAEYLTRVFLHAAPLADPRDVAKFLASYAREAKYRLQGKELPALNSLRSALEEALGIAFTEGKAEHFFRSTLIQTLFYGIFSAWVMWSKEHPLTDSKAVFDWRTAAWTLHVPMIGALFEQVVSPTKLRPLDLEEVLDWTAAILNRVDRAEFFKRFADGEAVQYFYEPFLAAFDPDLRKEMGVWYTPPEIVQYMVERVDRALRSELGVADGLADENVYVLDPCCGTGAYLVEVLRRISRTLDEKGGDALSRQDVKRAALKRVFGFELLPAPYVVAHLQLGLLLQDMGAQLNIDDAGNSERVAVYLTNALTGWEPNLEPPKKLFPELDMERDAAEKVKQQVPILVILGNPPYNAFAGVAPKEEQGLVNVYKEGLQSEWGIKKFNLDDLYVRFFRLAERRIAEKTGRGIVCFISSSSYMDDASYVVMRKRLLNGFDVIHIDNMNGDSRETGKLTPSGQPDPSVFSTEHNKEGIRVGTAISLLVRKNKGGCAVTHYRDFWGITKRQDVRESLEQPKKFKYKKSNPESANRFSFKPMDISENYQSWPRIIDLCAVAPIPGLQEMRRGAMIDTDKAVLAERMQRYFLKEVSWTELCKDNYGFCIDGGRFNASSCREKVLSKETFDERNIKKYSLFPLEKKWAYIAETRPLWNEPRPELSKLFDDGSIYIITRYHAERPHEYIPITMIQGCLPDYHLLRPNVVAIPLKIRKKTSAQLDLFEAQPEVMENLSHLVKTHLASINATVSDHIWYHVLSTGFAPSYLNNNKAAVLNDWPRIPLPPTKESLESSAALGRRIAALLDADISVTAVNSGQLNPIFRSTGRLSASSTDIALDPEKGHLELTAGWGHAGKDGVTMPGKGKIIEREYTPQELEAIEQGAPSLGLTLEEALSRIGASTCDIYLNNIALWRNVPKNVWEYYIGGYQVIKKWLSYRESALLGRGLTPDEARYVTDVVRRLAALRLMEKELDINYRTVIG